MPPKPDAKKNDPAAAQKEELALQLRMVKQQCEMHERSLQISSEQMQRSQLESLNLKKKIVELNEMFRTDEALTASMTHDMFRVYTSVQSQLIEKIATHQQTIRGLREDLDASRLKLERTKAEMDKICEEKTLKINKQKELMEEMAVGFGHDLKTTLEQMSTHIQGERTHLMGA